MAVIISGDTGIDKITDGSVVTADLASTLDLSGKTMTYGNLPAANLTGSLPAGMGGKILQVVQTFKSDVFSTSSTSYVDVTDLSVSITPSSTSSKILVMITMSGSQASAGDGIFQLLRNSTAIANSTGVTNASFSQASSSVASQTNSLGLNYLDSPSTTSSTTYKIQGRVNSGTLYVNRRGADAVWGGSSTITAIEVAA